jgi:predicted SnoaL-like aldol condensation-catalyzing enzyme
MSASQSLSAPDLNKHLVLRWFEEVWNQSRRETIFELLSPDCVIYDGDAPIRGHDGFAAFYDRLHSEFTDFHITPGAVLAEGDLASLRWSVSARHKASGKPTQVSGISIVRIQDGKFIEAWQNWDTASLAAQLA